MSCLFNFWQLYFAKTSNNNRLTVTSNYDFTLAMLLGSSRNGRLEVTRLSVPTTFGTVSVIRRNALCNKSELTAPGSLNICPMCELQRWIFNEPLIILWYTWPSNWGHNPKDPAVSVKSLLKAFSQFGTAKTRSVNSIIDNSSLLTLWNPGTLTPWHSGTLAPWHPNTLTPWHLTPLHPHTLTP